MTKITTVGSSEHRIISAKVLAALKTLETELGVTFSTNGGYTGQIKGTIKLDVSVNDPVTGKSGAEREFAMWAPRYGLKPEWFGKTFWDRGVQYRITGVNPNSPKYSLAVVRVDDGKEFKFTASGVKRGIEAEIAIGRLAA